MYEGKFFRERVTLNGIKKRGLTNWVGRETWLRRTVSIFSSEHHAWWRPDAQGYTKDENEAWEVDFPTAWERTKHCGPEKGIEFYSAGRKRY